MQSLDQQIENVLGIGGLLDGLEDSEPSNQLALPITVEYEDVPTAVTADSGMNKDHMDDYMLARKVLHGSIKRCTVALEQVLTIGRAAESLKAFEVSAKIMKELTNMTDRLTALHEQKPVTVKIENQTNVQNNVQNNINTTSDEKSVSNMLSELDDE